MPLLPRLRVILLTALCVAGALVAGRSVSVAHAATPHSPASGHATILVLDMSGSMTQNDPNGLRCSAANAYIDLSGPGDFIGVVGLDDPNGNSGGSHTAQAWAQPAEMATVSARQALRNTIAQDSHNCQPDGNTPTYDALNQAYTMLSSIAQNGITGSVILLTDGTPYPNTNGQISQIKSQLYGKFKAAKFPIDTIALGQPGSQNGVDFHGFLQDIANNTSGNFYDDGKGAVSGVSPLNLAPFFVQIFALRNGRTLGSTVPPTSLNGGTTSRNFAVGKYVSHLDVIAIKDNPNTTVTLTSPPPGSQTITATNAGAFVSTDPHYVIFAIDPKQPGQWQINVSGSGQFLMDSLVVPTLQLSIASPAQGAVLPLGQAFPISASLTTLDGNKPQDPFTVVATIQPSGQTTTLTLDSNTGNYTGNISVPLSNAAGSYEIDVTANAPTEIAATAAQTVRIEKFPTATFISPTTGQPTTDPISAHVVQWDGVLRFLYGSVPFFNSTLIGGWHPSDWPLQGLDAQPQALIHGEVLLGGATYNNATVIATEHPLTGNTCNAQSGGTLLSVINDQNGFFRVLFPTGAKGSYCVTLETTGSYKDSFGDLTTAASPVIVTIGLPTLADELRAWGITVLYLLGLFIIGLFGVYGLPNYAIRAKPNGNATVVDLEMQRRAQNRRDLDAGRALRWQGWSLRRYFAPNRLPGGEVTLPNNVFFVFRHGNEVGLKVRRAKTNGEAKWQIDGRTISAADGTETLLDRTRVTFTEGRQTTELQFMQAARDASAVGSGDVRDRLGNLADKIPGRGPQRKD